MQQMPGRDAYLDGLLAEARVSQVEAELRLMLVEAEVSRLEGRLSHLEAELADLRNARADDASPISPMLAASPDAYIEELYSGTSGSLRPSALPSLVFTPATAATPAFAGGWST